MRLWTILNEIQFRTTFIGSFFDAMRIFGSVQPKMKYHHYYTADISNYAEGAHL